MNFSLQNQIINEVLCTYEYVLASNTENSKLLVLSEGMDIHLFSVLLLLYMEKKNTCENTFLILIIVSSTRFVSLLCKRLNYGLSVVQSSYQDYEKYLKNLNIVAFIDGTKPTERSNAYMKKSIIISTPRFIIADILHRRLHVLSVGITLSILAYNAYSDIYSNYISPLKFLYHLLHLPSISASKSANTDLHPHIITITEYPSQLATSTYILKNIINHIFLYPRFRIEVVNYYNNTGNSSKMLKVRPLVAIPDPMRSEVIQMIRVIMSEIILEIKNAIKSKVNSEIDNSHTYANASEYKDYTKPFHSLFISLGKKLSLSTIISSHKVQQLIKRITDMPQLSQFKEIRTLILDLMTLKKLHHTAIFHSAIYFMCVLENEIQMHINKSNQNTKGVGINTMISKLMPTWTLSSSFQSLVQTATSRIYVLNDSSVTNANNKLMPSIEFICNSRIESGIKFVFDSVRAAYKKYKVQPSNNNQSILLLSFSIRELKELYERLTHCKNQFALKEFNHFLQFYRSNITDNSNNSTDNSPNTEYQELNYESSSVYEINECINIKTSSIVPQSVHQILLTQSSSQLFQTPNSSKQSRSNSSNSIQIIDVESSTDTSDIHCVNKEFSSDSDICIIDKESYSEEDLRNLFNFHTVEYTEKLYWIRISQKYLDQSTSKFEIDVILSLESEISTMELLSFINGSALKSSETQSFPVNLILLCSYSLYIMRVIESLREIIKHTHRYSALSLWILSDSASSITSKYLNESKAPYVNMDWCHFINSIKIEQEHDAIHKLASLKLEYLSKIKVSSEIKEAVSQELFRNKIKRQHIVNKLSGGHLCQLSTLNMEKVQSNESCYQYTFSNRIILVDERELRSELPYELYSVGVHPIPMTLLRGDYIISKYSAIERKSLPDLLQSLKSGRLCQQLHSLSLAFNYPTLLIEFSHMLPFVLLPTDIMPIYANQNIYLKQKLLQICFSCFINNKHRLSVLWSRIPSHSAYLISALQRFPINQNESALLSISDPFVDQQHSNKELTSNAKAFLLELPGITSDNLQCLIKAYPRLHALGYSTHEDLKHCLGVENGTQLYNFLSTPV